MTLVEAQGKATGMTPDAALVAISSTVGSGKQGFLSEGAIDVSDDLVHEKDAMISRIYALRMLKEASEAIAPPVRRLRAAGEGPTSTSSPLHDYAGSATIYSDI
jgi:hypothetical protein